MYMNGSTFDWEERGRIFTGKYSSEIDPPSGAIAVTELWDRMQDAETQLAEAKERMKRTADLTGEVQSSGLHDRLALAHERTTLQERIKELERENVELMKEANSFATLKEGLPGIMSLLDAEPPEGQNYVEFTVAHKPSDGVAVEFVIEIIRKDRRSPHQLRRDAEQRAVRLEAELERLRKWPPVAPEITSEDMAGFDQVYSTGMFAGYGLATKRISAVLVDRALKDGRNTVLQEAEQLAIDVIEATTNDPAITDTIWSPSSDAMTLHDQAEFLLDNIRFPSQPTPPECAQVAVDAEEWEELNSALNHARNYIVSDRQDGREWKGWTLDEFDGACERIDSIRAARQEEKEGKV